MRKRSEEESACKMEWLEDTVTNELRLTSTSKSEREGVQGGSSINNGVRVGDGGTDEKTGLGDVCG